MDNKRIYILDSFRAIAILLVMVFHYFSRWTSLYPYGEKYDFFSYGKMGVHFFFVISGFVILYTLECTPNFIIFWKKRMLRLFPSMLIASTITFLIFILFDNGLLFPNSHSIKNIFVSSTFIQPDLLSSLTGRKFEFDYISGSYWSLWLEIQFYAFASLLFYWTKKNFNAVFFIVTFLILLISLIVFNVDSENFIVRIIKSLCKTFNLFEALPFFSFGILFYLFYKNKTSNLAIPIWQKINFVLLLIFQGYIYKNEPQKMLFVLGFLFMFFLLINQSKSLAFLENKFLIKIGVASYFLYLIHENIGVLLINKLGGYFSPIEFVWPLFIIGALTMISIFYTYKVDKRINTFLKKYIE